MGGRNIYPTDIERARRAGRRRARGQRGGRPAGRGRGAAPGVVRAWSVESRQAGDAGGGVQSIAQGRDRPGGVRGRGAAGARWWCSARAACRRRRRASCAGPRPARCSPPAAERRPTGRPRRSAGDVSMVALLRRECSKATMLRKPQPSRRRRCVTGGSARQRVEPVLRRLQAVGQQRLGGVRGEVDRELQLLALGAGEPLEHEVRRVLPARGAADAEADAQVVLGPSDALIDRRPLWPPSPPPCLRRTTPNPRSRSSCTTSRSAGATP